MPVLPYNQLVNRLQYNSNIACELETFVDRSLFFDAVFLASESLYAEIPKRFAGAADAKKGKLDTAIYKYLLRMATRSTPYGLFAGCALGRLSDHPTSINLSERTAEEMYRIDISCMSALAEKIPLLDKDIRQHTIFFANSSIYETGETFRYYEYKLTEGKRWYHLSSIARNEFTEAVVSAALHGASFEKLTGILVEKNADLMLAEGLVEQLLKYQVLVTEYVPALTGGDPLDDLVARLEAKPLQVHQHPVLEEITGLKAALSAKDGAVSKGAAIEQGLKKIMPDLQQKDCIQADLFFNLESNTLNKAAVNTIISQVEQLLPLNNPATWNNLEQFKQQFYQKFEDREIPLLEALDSDIGIGYGDVTGNEAFYTPVIDDLVLEGATTDDTGKWGPHEHFVLAQFIKSQQAGSAVINITDEDLEALAAKKDGEVQRLPATFSILGSILTRSQKDFDSKDFSFLLKSCGESSAMSLMSRFGSRSPDIACALKQVAAYESSRYPGKILAEIIHLPEGRAGNVLARPRAFDYEIPFLGKGAAGQEFIINISDLWVSVKENRIILRSGRLGKEVLPRLTSAHNFSTGLPVYKFLCELQFQDAGLAIAWDWGVLSKLPFLPRVVYKNIILKRRRWFIERGKAGTSPANPEKALAAFREAYPLPNLVLLIEGDNELLLDLRNDISRSVLTSKMNKGDVILYEFLNGNEGALLADQEKQFDNEVVIPVKNRAFVPVPASSSRFNTYDFDTTSFFIPGSEWLYLKIYAGYKSMDMILSQIIHPLVRRWAAKEKISQWFFIRYQDPDSHLRLRLHVQKPAARTHIMKAINKAVDDLMKTRLIHRLEYGTYFRETEKYTPWAIDLCEQFFYADSRLVATIVDYIWSTKDEDARWLMGIKGVDRLLTDFNYTLPQKAALMEHCYTSFFKEFNGGKALLLQLNQKYRNEKQTFHTLLEDPLDGLRPYFMEMIAERSTVSRQVLECLQERITQRGEDPAVMQTMVHNFVHLFINRLFVASHRLHELVIYHHLFSYYNSCLSREAARK
ncbi:MAG TPA: lantibiotic dehydratase [Chitinophaga sp.]|nr:lantibiotic dehydratase [Chitinophaga sp.]